MKNLIDFWLKMIGVRPIQTPEAKPLRPVPNVAPSDNRTRWEHMDIREEWKSRVEIAVVKALAGKEIYLEVQKRTSVPWQIVACLHMMECNFSFNKHLHNGDPLTAKTVQVPKGRPLNWNHRTMTWQDSAVDALEYDRLDKSDWTTISSTLYNMERYNGLGYRKMGVPSPYLWSGTTAYTRGKYIEDGVYSPTAVSKQLGIAPLLKRLGYVASRE